MVRNVFVIILILIGSKCYCKSDSCKVIILSLSDVGYFNIKYTGSRDFYYFKTKNNTPFIDYGGSILFDELKDSTLIWIPTDSLVIPLRKIR